MRHRLMIAAAAAGMFSSTVHAAPIEYSCTVDKTNSSDYVYARGLTVDYENRLVSVTVSTTPDAPESESWLLEFGGPGEDSVGKKTQFGTLLAGVEERLTTAWAYQTGPTGRVTLTVSSIAMRFQLEMACEKAG